MRSNINVRRPNRRIQAALILSAVSSSRAFSSSSPTSSHVVRQRRDHPHSPSLQSQSSHTKFTTSLNLAFDVQTFQSAAAAVDNFYRTAPLESAFLTCGIKGSLADAIAQKLDKPHHDLVDDDNVEKTSTINNSARSRSDSLSRYDEEQDGKQEETTFDASRNLAYVIYGGLYTGIAQHFIYNEIFPQIFGDDPTPLTVLSEVAANALIVGPMLGLPVAYLTKALVLHPTDGNPLAEGLKRYAEDVQLKGLLLKYWALWVPVQAITFAYVPEHLRITFMAFGSFFWFVILSVVSAEEEVDVNERSASTVPPASTTSTVPPAFPQRP
jgi:protein Mpv17